MDIKGTLRSKTNKPINLEYKNSVEKKLKSKESIKEHLELNKEYSDEDIEIPAGFLDSITDYKNLFTNKVDKNNKDVNVHIVDNLKLITDNIFYVVKNTEQVNIDINNKKRLKAIIMNYDQEWIEVEGIEGENLFKVAGVKTNVTIGRKKERLNSFRIYLRVIKENENTIYKLIFVDPYHLAIPSGHKGNPASVVREQTFNKCKYYGEHIRILIPKSN